MHARTSLIARTLTGLLALAGAALPTLGVVASAGAAGLRVAHVTKQGSDGHPYYWTAPC